ncbi:MAG: acetylxylan esterase [Povalibacter sp.]
MRRAVIHSLWTCIGLTALCGSNAAETQAPQTLTAEQDHRRLLDLLKIQELRRGPDGDPKSPRAANFDETKVVPTQLPALLTLANGHVVTTADQWWQQRRPELVELFDREIYGRVPKHVPKVRWELQSQSTEKRGAVPVTKKILVGRVDNSAFPAISVNIDLTLVTPSDSSRAVPVMIEFIFPGTFPGMTEEQQRQRVEWQQQVLDHGWGYALLVPTSVQADNGAGLTQGIIGLVNKGQPRGLDDWGALRAWAWGAGRALDYLKTDKAVDGQHVGIEGLSRYGKAALVTMAYDDRFAIGFIGSSGAGGAKLWRRNFGEQLENVASSSEYHWMAGNFLKYAGPLTVNDLPIDAHELIALVAPRPLFISSGSQQVEGGWVDAKGMFLATVAAGPAYQLLGRKPLATSTMPPMETGVLEGDLAWRQHSGGHTTAPNWPTFLQFADRYMGSVAGCSSPAKVEIKTSGCHR